MSASRIIRRNRWRRALAAEGLKKADAPFHGVEVQVGNRHPSFQARKRKARIARGLRPGSTNMHRLDGARL